MTQPTVNYQDISDRYIGIGIPVVVTGLIAGVLLQFTRRVRKMPSYFTSNFSFFKGKSPKLPIVFTILYYILLAIPIILHLVWVILLGVNVGANPALPVLFYGIFIGLIFLPSFSRLFYFKVLALFITFILAEMVTLGLPFQTTQQNSFYALTAVMLTLNSIFVALCLWIMDGSYWSIPSHVPSYIKDKIRQQIKIWKKQQQPPEIITGGIYGAIMDMGIITRIVIISITYVLSLGVLIIYSVVSYYNTSTAYQALVNSVAIFTTDIISFILIFISKKTGFNPIINSLVAVLMRVFIIIFSGQFWFGGYCVIYLVLMIYIMVLVINKYYPDHERFPTSTVMKTNIFKMPQFAAFILLLMFGGLVFFMGNDNGKTLPIAEMTIGQIVYPFWAVGVAVILISFAVFFYLISMRIIERARKRVRSINFYYMGCDGCGEYYFFLLLSYLFLVAIGFYLWSRVGSAIIWASCVFLPLFYQAFVLFYINWKENDYLLLGDPQAINKKIKKRRQRQQKIDNMKQSVLKKMNQGAEGQEQVMLPDEAEMKIMDKAQIQQNNFMVQNYDGKSEYSDWRDQMNIFQAVKDNKLLPTDKKIITSIIVMAISLVVYSIVFFFSADRDMTAFTISVEILVIFLGFIPVKRYFSTFQKPNIFQIISFILAFLLNYGFGIVSYIVGWNKTPAYTVLWAIINVFLVLAYASFCLARDKGLIIPTYICCISSIVVSYGVGILLIVLFEQLVIGIVFLGLAFYYTYALVVYFIYIKMDKSLPFVIYIVTFFVIVATCFAIMIFAFVSQDFDNFYGFSVTYLVINFMILLYASVSIIKDYLNRYQKPNFYSAYGSPIYKYNPEIKSVVENLKPMRAWLGGWFMYFIYCLLLMIFLVDSDVGVSASQIFLIVCYLTFIYFTTFNLHRAGRIKDEITKDILQKSLEQVISIKQKSLGSFLNLQQIERQLQHYQRMKSQNKNDAPSTVKINPKQGQGDRSDEIKNTEQQLSGNKSESKDIDLIIFELQNKLDKAKQNDKILLVDFYTTVIFRCETIRKKKMILFNNFIRDSAEVLADGGIAILLDQTLYDLQSMYNEAYQQYMALSPVQKIYFNKQMKLYQEKKKQEQKKKEQMNSKETQNQIKRMQQLQNKLLNDNLDEDPDLPVDKMRDSPAKYQKLKQTLNTEYTDNQFRANNDILPAESRAECKGWKRPSPDSVVFKESQSGMSVRQGMIGDCYLISAIGTLGRDRIKQIICDPSKGPQGGYLVKFNKFNRDLYVMIDDNFPVYDSSADNQWLFGRCEDQKQIFCNIIEKAYAKLYGGYQNIVGGKVALALSDITGGFPQQIQLKQYQEQNMDQIFRKMLQFKKAGYLMGAGTPPHQMGDSAQIDGIFQGHAYLVLDVRNLDGNKIIKVRNPHGNDSQQSTLDWSDDSPKWTKRLKGLINQQMGADGAFWIGLQDFVYCYRALYICRIFDDTFVKVGPISGAWTGKKAAGLRSSKGRAQLQDNPHYGIRVTKQCNLFIELTQNELEGGRAKNKIFFMVQRNNGRRVQAPSTNKMAGMSGPAINSRTISKQIHLKADSYPYTFSLMTAIYEEGVQGSFSLSMYCNDKNMQITQDDQFDV